MTRIAFALLGVAFLAACGVDGAPTRPEPRPAVGLTISGTAEIGITGGN